MWSHQGDHPAVNRALRVESFRVNNRRRIPKPDFYLSAAKSPYPPYHELNDPYLESYYARPSMRKVLLEHGIIHPKDYEVIFGPAKSGKAQSTQETLRKITLLTRAERREVAPERDLLPYLPDAMRRLVRAGTKMNETSMQDAKAEIMSTPLDYIVIRLEEQLRAVKNAAYEAKQPTVMRNMKNLGFKDIYYKNIDVNNEEDMRKLAVLRRQQSAFRHWEDRYLNHQAKKLEKTRAEKMLDMEHHRTEAPDSSHPDQHRAHSTAGSRLRIKLNHDRALADQNRRKRQESRPAVKGTRKETLAIEYRRKEDEKVRRSSQRPRSRRRTSTGRPRSHKCAVEDPFEQNIHRKAAKRLAAESRQRRRKQEETDTSRSVTPEAQQNKTENIPTITGSSTAPMEKFSGRFPDSSRSKHEVKETLSLEPKDTRNDKDKDFRDKDFRLPKSPSGTWPWKELQAEKEQAEMERLQKSAIPENPTNLLRIASNGAVHFDTASEDVDIGSSEPGFTHPIPVSRQHPASTDHKEHLSSDVQDPLAAGFLRPKESEPPQSISFYDFDHKQDGNGQNFLMSDGQDIPSCASKTTHPVEEHDQMSLYENPDRFTVSSPLDYSRSAQYEASEPSDIPPERDPLAKMPSGNWPWQTLKQEQIKQSQAPFPQASSQKMLLHTADDGVDHMDTKSSIVDVNEPEFEDDAAFILDSTLLNAQALYNDYPEDPRSSASGNFDKKVSVPSAFDAEKPKDMDLDELKRHSHHDINVSNAESRHRPKSAELQKMVATHEKWSPVKVAGIENGHTLEPLKESEQELPPIEIPKSQQSATLFPVTSTRSAARIPSVDRSVMTASSKTDARTIAKDTKSTHFEDMDAKWKNVPESKSEFPPSAHTIVHNEPSHTVPVTVSVEDVQPENDVLINVLRPSRSVADKQDLPDHDQSVLPARSAQHLTNGSRSVQIVPSKSGTELEDDVQSHATDIADDIIFRAEDVVVDDVDAQDDTAVHTASGIMRDVIHYAENVPSSVHLVMRETQ